MLAQEDEVDYGDKEFRNPFIEYAEPAANNGSNNNNNNSGSSLNLQPPEPIITFEDIKREQVVEYVKEKYGNENVAIIWTYMTMAAKAAFKDVASTFGISFDQANKISNMITEETIQKSIDENEEFKNKIDISFPHFFL